MRFARCCRGWGSGLGILWSYVGGEGFEGEVGVELCVVRRVL